MASCSDFIGAYCHKSAEATIRLRGCKPRNEFEHRWISTFHHSSTTTLLSQPEITLTSHNVNTGILIPFSFNFTNCSCTSLSKRIRSCARGDRRCILPCLPAGRPLPKRDAKPRLKASRRLLEPNLYCGRLVMYSFNHVKNRLSSPIGFFLFQNCSLIVFYT